MELLYSRKISAFSLRIGTDASESAYILEVSVLRAAIELSHRFIVWETLLGWGDQPPTQAFKCCKKY